MARVLDNSAVHKQDIPNVMKFSYLKSSLRNSAAAAICGISVTNDYCPVAIYILQDEFGKKEAIIEALFPQLQHLPIVTNRFIVVKSTYEIIERILRQLKVSYIIVIILCHIPSSMCHLVPQGYCWIYLIQSCAWLH